MRDHGIIPTSTWTGERGRRFREAGILARLIFHYLKSCPSSTSLGVFYIPLPTLCHEVGCSLEDARAALQDLARLEEAFYDEASEYVFVPTMATEEIAERLKSTDNRLSWIKREVEKLRHTPFFAAFLARYGNAFLLHDLASEVSPSEAPSKPLPSPHEGTLITGAGAGAVTEPEKREDANAQSQTTDASSPTLAKPSRKSLPVDEEFLNELRAISEFSGLVDPVLAKLKIELLTPWGKRKRLTRKLLVAWLKREWPPKPMNGTRGGLHVVERIADKDFHRGW